LANVLGIPSSKDDIDGSMVQDVYYKEKDIKRIVNYCQKDVVVVAQIIQRFKNLPLIDVGNISIAE
jgi:predicted methyltransferase